ncbi:hypothetical protein TARUN_3295 [Trichoderma arundinaceum]|uniref:Uncharacterized protein n=1 Tax=Trichoderma arundinaceum TaxID=490622 RepID=A0A395NSC0_TRIAR|nr:hypothetical protein TARUN_3295 [Trichoderma arundinaceum]
MAIRGDGPLGCAGSFSVTSLAILMAHCAAAWREHEAEQSRAQHLCACSVRTVRSPLPMNPPGRPISYGHGRDAGPHCNAQEGLRADADDDCGTDSASMKPSRGRRLCLCLCFCACQRAGGRIIGQESDMSRFRDATQYAEIRWEKKKTDEKRGDGVKNAREGAKA